LLFKLPLRGQLFSFLKNEVVLRISPEQSKDHAVVFPVPPNEVLVSVETFVLDSLDLREFGRKDVLS
jgi:hypothetical protein